MLNPDISAKKKFSMKPPVVSAGLCVFVGRKVICFCVQVVKDGTKRVIIVNFHEIVTSMNRTADHLLSFMLAELGEKIFRPKCSLVRAYLSYRATGTSGSADAQGRVTFKYAGRQAQKHMESVIKQYVKEYVLCKLCKSSDTKLNKVLPSPICTCRFLVLTICWSGLGHQALLHGVWFMRC